MVKDAFLSLCIGENNEISIYVACPKFMLLMQHALAAYPYKDLELFRQILLFIIDDGKGV